MSWIGQALIESGPLRARVGQERPATPAELHRRRVEVPPETEQAFLQRWRVETQQLLSLLTPAFYAQLQMRMHRQPRDASDARQTIGALRTLAQTLERFQGAFPSTIGYLRERAELLSAIWLRTDPRRGVVASGLAPGETIDVPASEAALRRKWGLDGIELGRELSREELQQRQSLLRLRQLGAVRGDRGVRVRAEWAARNAEQMEASLVNMLMALPEGDPGGPGLRQRIAWIRATQSMVRDWILNGRVPGAPAQ